MTTSDIIPHLPSFLPPKRGFTFVVRARPTPNLLAEPRQADGRVRFGLCFGLGLASFAANTRQTSGEKAGGDIAVRTKLLRLLGKGFFRLLAEDGPELRDDALKLQFP